MKTFLLSEKYLYLIGFFSKIHLNRKTFNKTVTCVTIFIEKKHQQWTKTQTTFFNVPLRFNGRFTVDMCFMNIEPFEIITYAIMLFILCIPACTTLPCTSYTSMHHVTMYLVYQHAPSSLRIQSNMRFIPIFKLEQKSFVMTFFHIYIYASFPFNPWFPLKQINNNKQYKQSW